MIYESACTVLQKVKELTESGTISWEVDPNDQDCFQSSKIDNRGITIEFLYVEPTTTGADRHLIHFEMEGVNFFAACGTRSYGLVIEILAAAFDKWNEHLNGCLAGHSTALKKMEEMNN